MTDPRIPVDWQVPAFDAHEKRKIGWIDEACQTGERWWQTQRSYRDFKGALDILCGEEPSDRQLDYRSRLASHRLRTNMRVNAAGLSNIRPMWGYHATQTMAPYASVLNRTSRALYLENNWDQSLKEAIMYSLAFGTGFVRPVYKRNMAGRGRGNIELLTYGPPSVRFTQIPSDGNLQEAYAVTLLEEMPIFQAHAKWPLFADLLQPTSSRYWYSSDIRQTSKANKKKSKLFPVRDADGMPDLFIPIRWTHVLDLSLNTGKAPIKMGQEGSSWEYTVPFLGQQMDNGRIADENDARKYPNRRLIISSERCIMYDGPGFNWHGEVDLIPFTLDKYPWEPFGFSAARDGFNIQKSIDQIARGTMDKINAQMALPLAYDMNMGVTKSDAESFDPFEPRARIGFDGSAGDKPFINPVPPEIYRVEPETTAWLQKLESDLDYQTQSRDIVELGKARALGKGMDQLEALISASGPLVKDMSRAIEQGLTGIGRQLGFMIPQYMSTARLMQYNDPESMKDEVFDYDPGSLIPSHLPDDKVFDEGQNLLPSKYSLLDRARWFAQNVHFSIMPHSAHELLQMTHRLMLLQLKKLQAPISWATILQSCGIPDVKMPPGNSEQERAASEAEEMLMQQARMAKEAQAIAGDLGLGGMPQPGGGGGKKSGSGPKGGRPNSLAVAPHMETKDGGARSIVSTSN